MDWNCTLTEERLSDFLEGQLSAGEVAALTAHKGTCSRCADLVARVGRLLQQIHSIEPVEAPASLHERIVEATLGRRAEERGWRGLFAWVPLLWQPRFAVGLATVAACCVVVVQAGGVTPGKLRHADLNPVNMFRSVDRQAHLTYARLAKSVNDLRVVYEIQSRLEPVQQPTEAPPPRQQHDPRSHSTYPQQKSETHRGRNESRESVVAQDFRPQILETEGYLENGANGSCP